MRGEEICKVVGGYLIGKPKEVKGFSFDTREIKEGEFFVPLKGRRDGHAFIEEAFKRGALGAFTETPKTPPSNRFLVKVQDTFSAFREIARFKRLKFRGLTVAVTGSVGKSTTKELLFHVLSKFFKAYKNVKSFNNEIGVIYTLSNIPRSSDLLIQEIGTNSPGEVSYLRELVKPDISIVTSVGIAHMEGFKDLDLLKEEKLSLTEGVEFAIVPSPFASHSKATRTVAFGYEGDVRLGSLRVSSSGTEFSVLVSKEELKFRSTVPGMSVVNGTLILVAVSKILGIPLTELPPLVETFTPPSGRLKVERFGSTYLIDDSYNANPTSFQNALEVFSLFEGEKVAVVGQMLELGRFSEEEHRKLGELLNKVGVSTLISYGEEAFPTYEAFKGEKYHFINREDLLSLIKEMPLEGKVFLVKGSRSNRLEEVCQIIRERLRG